MKLCFYQKNNGTMDELNVVIYKYFREVTYIHFIMSLFFWNINSQCYRSKKQIECDVFCNTVKLRNTEMILGGFKTRASECDHAESSLSSDKNTSSPVYVLFAYNV